MVKRGQREGSGMGVGEEKERQRQTDGERTQNCITHGFEILGNSLFLQSVPAKLHRHTHKDN